MLERLLRFVTEDKPRAYTVEFRNSSYTIQSTKPAARFLEWFEEYTRKAPICSSCRRLMLPGESVARHNNDFMHPTCCLATTGGLFVGRLTEEGIILNTTTKEPMISPPEPVVVS